MSISNTIYVAAAADILPLLAGLTYVRHLNRPLRLLILFYLFILGVNVSNIYSHIHQVSNLWGLNAFIMVEYAFLAYIFSFWIDRPKVKKLLQTSIPLMILSWVIVKLCGATLFDTLHYFKVVESSLLISLSTYKLHKITSESESPSYQLPEFWISVGVLLYFSGNILLFIAMKLFLDMQLFAKVWMIHVGLNVVANLFYSGGFLSQGRLKSCGSLYLEPQ